MGLVHCHSKRVHCTIILNGPFDRHAIRVYYSVILNGPFDHYSKRVYYTVALKQASRCLLYSYIFLYFHTSSYIPIFWGKMGHISYILLYLATLSYIFLKIRAFAWKTPTFCQFSMPDRAPSKFLPLRGNFSFFFNFRKLEGNVILMSFYGGKFPLFSYILTKFSYIWGK